MLNKVIIADEHVLLVEGLTQSLRMFNEELCAISATSAKQLRELIISHQNVDLIILDLDLSDDSGLSILDFIRQQMPDTPVIILSASDDLLKMRTAINKGAKAYLTKVEPLKVILTAIQLVLAGGTYIPPALVHNSQTCSNRYVDNRRLELTCRQKEVLLLLIEGFPNKEIGRQLFLSEATVKAHVSAILKTLDVCNRTQAANAAKKLSLVAS